MDEKELFIIKTAHKGEVKFNVMSLEEPNEANAESLKAALENSIKKLGLNIERKERDLCFISTILKLCWFFFSNSISQRNTYTAVYVHVSTRLFHKNIPMEIKRNETFFKNSVQIYSTQLEISLIFFINQQHK